MQYNCYELQLTENGCIIRDSKGKYVLLADTEDEACEYVDSLVNREVKPLNTAYDKFVQYCDKLPGKCFINEKLATTNEKALNRYKAEFESISTYRVFTAMESCGGEYFFIVTSVE